MRTSEAAVGKWYAILPQLGIKKEYLRDKHGPCPLCGGKDRFRFDDKGGKGTFFCNNCGAGDGMRLAMEYTGLEFKEAAKKIDQLAGNIQVTRIEDKPKKDPAIRLKKVAQGLKKYCEGDPVSKYLNSRFLTHSGAIKIHPSMPYFEQGNFIDNYPAMVLLLQNKDGAPITYHITHLTNEGKKAPIASVKKILPPVSDMSGSAIRLFPVSDHIGVAEGIETALAVKKQFGIDCWAVCNTSLMESFEPPEGIKKVTVFCDNDDNYAGQRAGYTLANKLQRRKISSHVFVPTRSNTDYADEVADYAKFKR